MKKPLAILISIACICVIALTGYYFYGVYKQKQADDQALQDALEENRNATFYETYTLLENTIKANNYPINIDSLKTAMEAKENRTMATGEMIMLMDSIKAKK